MNFLYKKLFRIPRWMKPELNTIIYWVHLAVIGFVVLGLLQIFNTGGEMLTLKNVLLSIPLIGAGDFLAHAILKID